MANMIKTMSMVFSKNKDNRKDQTNKNITCSNIILTDAIHSGQVYNSLQEYKPT